MGRPDGKRVKDMDPLFKIIPNLMEYRHDSQVLYTVDVPIDEITKYINMKRDDGINIGYMHVFYLIFIRVLKDKPKLNRFVMQNRMYQRNKITISMTIKQSMTEDGEEDNIKCDFNGDETIEEVAKILNDAVKKGKDNMASDTLKFAKVLNKVPSWFARRFTKFMMFLDRRDLMPKSIIEVSPFHASAFFTNVGSIGIDSVFHHLYDFGTIGIFVSMGKKFQKLVSEKGVIKEAPHIKLSVVVDERIADGFYFASSMRLLNRYTKNPFMLDEFDDEYLNDVKEEEKLSFEKILEEIEGKEKTEKESRTIFKFPFSSFFKFWKRENKENKENKEEQEKDEEN